MTVGILMQLLASFPSDREVFIEYPHGNLENKEMNCVPIDSIGSGNYNRLIIGSMAMINKSYLKECLGKIRLENKIKDINDKQH